MGGMGEYQLHVDCCGSGGRRVYGEPIRVRYDVPDDGDYDTRQRFLYLVLAENGAVRGKILRQLERKRCFDGGDEV